MKTKDLEKFVKRGMKAQKALDGILEQARAPKCIVCGCTDERACPGGCYWEATVDLIMDQVLICSQVCRLGGILDRTARA